MWTIEELRGLDALDRVAAEWQNALDAWPGHTLFQTFAWSRTYAQHTAADSTAIVLRVLEDGQPRGLVPLAIRRLRSAGVPVGRLECLGTGPADRTGWLLPPGVPDAAVDAILTHILKRLKGWAVWDLRGMMAEAPGMAALLAQLETRRLPMLRGPDEALRVLRITEPWETYAARHFKTTDRARLRQLRRKLAALGQIGTRELTRVTDMEGLTARLREFPHREEGYGVAFQVPFAIPRLRGFMDAFTLEAAKAGWMQVATIELEGVIIAYRYDFIYRAQAYAYFSSFNPAYAACGPGRLLLTDHIEACFNRGYTHFHFLRGAEAYKAAWTEDTEQNLNALVFRASTLGRMLHAAYRRRDQRAAQPAFSR